MVFMRGFFLSSFYVIFRNHGGSVSQVDKKEEVPTRYN